MSRSVTPPPTLHTLDHARLWAQQHYVGHNLRTGEPMLAHAQGISEILTRLDVADELHITAYLFGYFLIYPDNRASREALTADWGIAQLERLHNLHTIMEMGAKTWHHTKEQKARNAEDTKKSDRMYAAQNITEQIERSRKMLLAMAHDIRVVILRLASRLQTLRYYAASKTECPPAVAEESLQLYAPLANRLGVWQIKWELEDLGFRFAQPQVYREIAQWLDEKRTEREAFVADSIARLQAELKKQNIQANISGRPKHIYSIYNKMRGKSLQFADLYDIRAFRIIVKDLKDCYGVLGVMHHLWQPIPKEFDDYIARPKPNGYQSLHTVVVGEDGRPMEVQIRTEEMHQFAEYGVAAHWRYKEGKFNNASGTSEQKNYDEQIAWVRQLISWQSDLTHNLSTQAKQQNSKQLGEATSVKLQDPSIYVLTPDAKVIELPQGATPIDFAYYVHTNIGHRCRGAKVNEHIVPLNTTLKTGQTVMITVAKQGGPSRDWLRDEFSASARTKSKIRAWFNAQDTQTHISTGRALFEKELQRLSKTAAKHDEVAQAFGFDKTDDLYIAYAREVLTARDLDVHFNGVNDANKNMTQKALVQKAVIDEQNFVRAPAAKETLSKSGVLVVGLDDLMTQLAQCCKPAPPDDISGFVTRGKGISIHRVNCDNFIHIRTQHPERELACTWASAKGMRYEIDMSVTALESVDMMRLITDALAREKILIAGLHKLKNAQTQHGTSCEYVFNLEVENTTQLEKARATLAQIKGVTQVARL
jgi:GTP pyrophosphokinase